jgi:hypothetical protein
MPYISGWYISLCGSLTQTNSFFTQIITQSINYVFSSIIHDGLPTFQQVFDSTLEEILRFSREEVVDPILQLSIVVEGNCTDCWRESSIGGNPMGQSLESRADVEESPSQVPEWPLSACLQCEVGRCHAEESLHIVNPGVFAGLLFPDAKVVDNSVWQFWSGSSQAVHNGQSPPYPTRCTTWSPQVQSVTRVKISLLEVRKPFFGCSFSNRVFSVDGTNVLGGLCSFGASIELVKKKVLEMFIFLNLTLYSFGPENFVPLVQIGKFQKVSIEENESYKMVYYT